MRSFISSELFGLVVTGGLCLLLCGCVTRPAPPPYVPRPTATPVVTSSPNPTTPAPNPLPQSFERLAEERLSIAVTAVGSDADPLVLGDVGTPVAWSTAKVPVAIAVERTDVAYPLRSVMERAITRSDNAAAEQLWSALGTPAEAALSTDGVLRDFGDSATQTNATRQLAAYSAFGQTPWALGDQARFAASLPCRFEAAPVYAAMGAITAEQRWGLGRIPGAHFKGGWGPSQDRYLVRQLGVLPAEDGEVAVAMAVEAATFEEGAAALSRAAQWLEYQGDDLPAGRCAD